MSSRFSESMIDFILAGILLFTAIILFGISIYTANTVFNSNLLTYKDELNSSHFFQFNVQNYIKIPLETDANYTTKNTESYSYWLAYSENNDIIIVETTHKTKPTIGNNVFTSQLQNSTKNATTEIIKHAELLDSKVAYSTGLYSLSSQEEYQKSWIPYAVSGVLVSVVGGVFLYSGIVAKKHGK